MVVAKKDNPELWEQVKKQIMAEEVAGTKAGQWSARKAQLAVKRYKAKGGGYVGEKSPTLSLVRWTKQDWTTKSGKPSSETGERYLPKKAIQALSSQQYAATTAKKRKDTKKGKQVSDQPESIAELVKKFR